MKSKFFALLFFLMSGSFLSAQIPKLGADADWCITEPIFFDKPECWISTNPISYASGLPANVSLTSDSYVGSQALKLETLMDDNGEIHTAVAILKYELLGRPDKLTGYYKADIPYSDYAGIRISLLSDRAIVGWGELDFDQSSIIFKPFEIPIQYISSSVIPDSFTLAIYSSLDQPMAGTSIVVDALKFEEDIDVTIPLTEKYITRLTPNPAIDEILVMVSGNIGQVDIRIFDGSGTQVIFRTFEYQLRIDVSDLTNGMYFYEVRRKDHSLYDKGRLNVARPKL
jgi:hypothetical protein